MEITFKVFWTETAINHLKDIFNYHLYKSNKKVSQTLIQKLIDSTLILERNPLSGRKEELLAKKVQEFRFLVVKNYKILYWSETKSHIIYVSGIFDTRRNPKVLSKLKPSFE